MYTVNVFKQLIVSVLTLSCLLVPSSVMASVLLRNLHTNTSASLPVRQIKNTTYVVLDSFCQAVNLRSAITVQSEKITVDAQKQLVFNDGNTWYLVNESLRQMAAPAVIDNQVVLIPLSAMVSLGHALCGDSIFFSGVDSSITIGVPERGFLSGVSDSTALKKKLPTVDKSVGRPDNVATVLQDIHTIVIDPGHGGMDPGAIGPSGVQEKSVVLAVGLHLRALIRKKTDMSVFMTRETDVFIPLLDRTKFSNTKKADLFISIHANSIAGSAKKRDQTRGYKIYFLSQAKNEEDKLAAMQENAVITLEQDTKNRGFLENLLVDMAGNEYLRESQDFSISCAEQFGIKVKNIPSLHRGVGQANFWVLNGAYMPSVLIEIGFISNPGEEKLLNNEANQKSIAEAVLNAVIQFKGRYNKPL